MKLESLNNKKFKLNTKEMGSLVGGFIHRTNTAGGEGFPPNTSADVRYDYTGEDVQKNNQLITVWEFYSGGDDVKRRDASTPPNR
jgi:hypothetical protein